MAAGCPAHILMGYWQDFANGATPLTLGGVPASYNLVAVAFGTATSTPGQVAFSLDPTLASDLGGYTQQQFISDIATLHSRGQKVILSVGGANGTVSVANAASASRLRQQRLLAHPAVRVRRRGHRPGERRQPDLHGLRA